MIVLGMKWWAGLLKKIKAQMAAASNESQNPKEMDKLQGACSKATFLQKSWEIKFLFCFHLRGGGVRVLVGLVFNA